MCIYLHMYSQVSNNELKICQLMTANNELINRLEVLIKEEVEKKGNESLNNYLQYKLKD